MASSGAEFYMGLVAQEELRQFRSKVTAGVIALCNPTSSDSNRGVNYQEQYPFYSGPIVDPKPQT